MKEKKTIVTRDIISRIETLHSEIQNVGRRLNDLDDEDENKPNNSTKTMSSTEEQIIKLETCVSEIRGLLVSNGLQEDFTSEVQKIDFDLEVQRKTLKTLRRRLAPNNDKEVNLTLSKLKLLEVQALKLTSWSTPSLFQWLMTQKDYLRANPLCGTILQSVYVPKLVDSL